MSEISVRADHVFKRFRKGEIYDSLRDLIPALTGQMFRRKGLAADDTREFWALNDVSFEVKRGEAFGIIGHNGAGKSTMLKLLSRIMQPTDGQVIVTGRLSALIEVSAGFHKDLTGRENIYLNGTILGMSRSEIRSKFDAIVEFSGLEEFIDTPVKRYSSGMFARLGFSVAAHVDPDVLIVDEVLSVGDFVFQQKCLARMNQIIDRGTTVLFVSHNLRAVGDLCQRGILLDHGRVAAMGEMHDVINSYMHGIRDTGNEDDAKDSRIKNVVTRRRRDECVRFKSGEKASIDIEIVGGLNCRKIAVVLFILDENRYEIFSTSTERLGYPAYDLNPGDVLSCQYEIDLNMAPGTYYMCVSLYRYDTQSVIDRWNPPGMFFIESDNTGSTGIVNCNPTVSFAEIRSSEDL